MKNYEVVIIGGGSAGLASAIELYKKGIKDILILERDKELGGILLQCIHNGFGLHTFNEELSGPAYAERYIVKLLELGIEYKLNSMVIVINEDKIIKYVNSQEGYQSISARAIILAMGCYERTRGSIAIPGYRPAGVYCAGTAQRYLNMEGYLVGRKVFILGSGDIGLIMARRMSLEGAEVLGVAELMPYSNGLPRNIKQCLEDFNIPLYLSHTVVNILGNQRVEKIVIAKVDESSNPIQGTEIEFEVDTLLLSVGLVPENGLSQKANVLLHSKTKGSIVNESYMTSVDGIFACGNVLHVHDLVDFVSLEGVKAAQGVVRYLNGQLVDSDNKINVNVSQGISYALPQIINKENLEDDLDIFFRVNKIYKKSKVILSNNGQEIHSSTKLHMAPAEMNKLTIAKKQLQSIDSDLTIEIKEV